mmetsp:Transcript_29811/g.78209  ORF Transcript_29811/g.78209 Transcript_29811/m.78209 type:complete len:247 (-) Transcript_29811:1274-2014(-)
MPSMVSRSSPPAASMPDEADELDACIVDTLNNRIASSTCSSVAKGIIRILASDSVSRTRASSCRTVMGMVARLPVRRSILWVSDRIRTKWSLSFSPASFERRGPHFIRQYWMYFLRVSIEISPSVAILSSARRCTFITKRASVASRASLCSSRTMKMRSNRDRMVDWNSMFSSASLVSSHRPKAELAAAMTEVRELSVVVIPALAIEMVCCSIASWIATRSDSLILSNSSMHTTPPSARTIAPPSR